ncbi:TPA: cytochrome C biogenesis protein [Candidatus Woesearchaeota archaeon]|nr:cytochrome C biogenesis protein [archaeon]HIJ11555.1 cytochrome C biogenesis protein [Candidatus Woesearchaeota archaeon]
MVSILTNIWIAFLAGLFAPLGAVCVLPLYPGFLAYLANKVSPEEEGAKKRVILFGIIVAAGVILSMFLVGLLFTGLFSASLTSVISIISPIAFGILAVISILLIFNVDFGSWLPKARAPVLKSPYWSSLIFGLFFGAIVLPCNPASLAILFAVSTSVSSFLTNLLNFIVFGIGMSIPLLVLAIISGAGGKKVISFLTTYKKHINIIAGVIMLGISVYYLFVVFRIHEVLF